MTDGAPALDPAAFDEIQRLVSQVGQQAVISISGGPAPSVVRQWVSRADSEAQSVGLEPTRGRLRPVRKFAAKLVWPTVAKSVDATRSVNRAVETLTDEVTANRNQLAASLDDLRDQIGLLRDELDTARRGIKELEIARMAQVRSSDPSAQPHEPSAASSSHGSFYVAFEDRFRGTRAEIADLLSVHLDHVKHLAGSGLPVVDVGCGRGEWLEVLHDAGVPAYGVDTLESVVSHCRALGFDARREDATHHLRSLTPGSIGAVTAFHLVEHLSFDGLMSFLAAARAALAPGGVLILETPNPTNVVVGAASFWTDPSHIRPMHPDLLQFVVDYLGFVDIQVQFLHPLVAASKEEDGDSRQLDAHVAWSLRGPQDYAVIARVDDQH